MKYYLQAIGIVLATIAGLIGIIFFGSLFVRLVLIPLYNLYEHWALWNIPQWALEPLGEQFGPGGILALAFLVIASVALVVVTLAEDLRRSERMKEAEVISVETSDGIAAVAVDKKTFSGIRHIRLFHSMLHLFLIRHFRLV